MNKFYSRIKTIFALSLLLAAINTIVFAPSVALAYEEDEDDEWECTGDGDGGGGGGGGGGGDYPITPQECPGGTLFQNPLSPAYINGGNNYGSHPGIDFACPVGQPIYAVNTGQVVLSQDIFGNQSEGYASFGRHIQIYHCSIGGINVASHYAHLSQRLVQSGEMVTKGQLIGYCGNTGHSVGSHLHFALYKAECQNEYSCPLNPYSYGIGPN